MEPSVRVMTLTREKDSHQHHQLHRERGENNRWIGQPAVIHVHRGHHGGKAEGGPNDLPDQKIIAGSETLRGQHCRGAEDHDGAKQNQHHHGGK